MAFDKKPSTWLGEGYAADAGAHTIILKTADASTNKLLSLLTDANANATTGDIRAVMLALIESLYAAFAAVSAGDRPIEMAITKRPAVTAGGQLQYSYTFAFSINVSGVTIASEPA